tara:strand:+ start:51 stop:392 length:342 start_codon:yes stop_codon:yes gene_type:complete
MPVARPHRCPPIYRVLVVVALVRQERTRHRQLLAVLVALASLLLLLALTRRVHTLLGHMGLPVEEAAVRMAALAVLGVLAAGGKAVLETRQQALRMVRQTRAAAAAAVQTLAP